ncbi:hypothetical protein B8W90_12125, partial [Staphylococcus hominis]
MRAKVCWAGLDADGWESNATAANNLDQETRKHRYGRRDFQLPSRVCGLLRRATFRATEEEHSTKSLKDLPRRRPSGLWPRHAS